MEPEVVIYVVKFDGNTVTKQKKTGKLSALGLRSYDLKKAYDEGYDASAAFVLVGNILMSVYEEGTIEEAKVIGVCENSSGYDISHPDLRVRD